MEKKIFDIFNDLVKENLTSYLSDNCLLEIRKKAPSPHSTMLRKKSKMKKILIAAPTISSVDDAPQPPAEKKKRTPTEKKQKKPVNHAPPKEKRIPLTVEERKKKQVEQKRLSRERVKQRKREEVDKGETPVVRLTDDDYHNLLKGVFHDVDQNESEVVALSSCEEV